LASCGIIIYDTHFAAVSACNALSNGWSKKSRYERCTAGSVIRRDRLTRSGTLPCTFLPVTHWAARAERNNLLRFSPFWRAGLNPNRLWRYFLT
jgi:hypothetical protein